MEILFTDKFGEMVWIENQRDIENVIEKYIGSGGVYPILEYIKKLQKEYKDSYQQGFDDGYDDGYLNN